MVFNHSVAATFKTSGDVIFIQAAGSKLIMEPNVMGKRAIVPENGDTCHKMRHV